MAIKPIQEPDIYLPQEEIGEKYRHEKSVYDGFQDHKWHLECDTDAAEYFADGEGEFLPYSQERPQKATTP